MYTIVFPEVDLQNIQAYLEETVKSFLPLYHVDLF